MKAGHSDLSVLALVYWILWSFSLPALSKASASPLNVTSLDAFVVRFEDPVALRITASAHYKIESADGDQEWSKILPPGPAGHLVYLRDREDPSRIRPYTVTLFHQLKCLDIIRRQFNLLVDSVASGANATNNDGLLNVRPLARHCMNYIRQIHSCHPGIWLESTRGSRGTGSRAYDAVCRDWTKVYESAAANRRAYDGHLSKGESSGH